MSPKPSFQNLTLEVKNGVAVITLNRPKSANSLHPELQAEWIAALRWCIKEPSVNVIVQTSTGKFFCTGMDFDNWPPPAEEFEDNMDSFIANFKLLNDVLITCDKVLIAAVNGACAGYGVTVLPLFDLVYAVPDSYYFCPFMKWGFSAEGCSTLTFPQIMGHQKASALLLAGEKLSAEEMSASGMITKIIPQESFQEKVMEVANRIASSPSHAPLMTKRMMMTHNREKLYAANALECQVLRERLMDPAQLEITSAYKQSRIQKKNSRL